MLYSTAQQPHNSSMVKLSVTYLRYRCNSRIGSLQSNFDTPCLDFVGFRGVSLVTGLPPTNFPAPPSRQRTRISLPPISVPYPVPPALTPYSTQNTATHPHPLALHHSHAAATPGSRHCPALPTPTNQPNPFSNLQSDRQPGTSCAASVPPLSPPKRFISGLDRPWRNTSSAPPTAFMASRCRDAASERCAFPPGLQVCHPRK